jgi:hypothetical protein
VTINANGNTSITGAVQTNGSVNINIGGTTTIGAVQYGDGGGTNCGPNNTVSEHGSATITAGPPQEATAFLPYPDTYSAVWTNSTTNQCSASSVYTANTYPGHGNITVSGGSSTVPNTVTFSGNNQTFGSASTPVVICANTITLSGQQPTLNDVTLVGKIVTGGNGLTITPDPNAKPDVTSAGGTGVGPAVAIYDTGTSTLDFSNNNTSILGAVYAPLAMVNIAKNNSAGGLIEANQVTITGNNTGDGPNQTLAGSGTDQLVQ